MKLSGLLMVCALLGTTGCRFEHHERSGDKNSDVKIATPFGGLSVKTDQKAVEAGVGLTPYPGATLQSKDDNGKDLGAANVKLNFGGFHLGVEATSYQSTDAPDKVLAFYRKDMAKYGTVIQCRDRVPVGQPTRTQDGLACDSESQGSTIHVNADGQMDLKAGSRQHQHIVSVEAKNGGSKIALVALDLPGNMGGDESKE